MPIDLDNSSTFGELALELAVQVGVAAYGTGGTGEASLPADVETLARVKRCMLRGIERLYGEDKQWSFLDHTETLTFSPDGTDPRCIDGDPARYLMPRYLRSGPKSSWVYADERVGCMAINPRPYIQVLARRQRLNITGIPSAVGWQTIAPSDEPTGSRKGMEMVFDPIPDAAYVVMAEFRVLPPKALDLDERHWCGREMEEAMLACAAELWYERADDGGQMLAKAMLARERLVKLAKNIDLSKRVKSPVRQTSSSRVYDVPRITTRGMTVNGQSVSG